jgi:hypothetical protein
MHSASLTSSTRKAKSCANERLFLSSLNPSGIGECGRWCRAAVGGKPSRSSGWLTQQSAMEATPTLVINYYSASRTSCHCFSGPTPGLKSNGGRSGKTLWSSTPWDDANDKATHFMGPVVTMPARSVPVGVSKFLIIDGQQRLTTISILMCAVRDMLSLEQQGASSYSAILPDKRRI